MKFSCFSIIVFMNILWSCTISNSAAAFGDEGHKIIATIAYARLTPTAKEKIDALLSSDADELTARDFVSRATWADKFRDSDRKSTKKHYNATHQWHFVDLDINKPDLKKTCANLSARPNNIPASAGPAKDCVVNKIIEFTHELNDAKTSPAEQLLALKFLLHFIGDIHQPLHAAEHQHDRGGNALPIKYIKHDTGKSNTDNLHAYWDKELVDRLGDNAPDIASQLLQDITPEEAAQWNHSTPIEWAMESHRLAKNVAYNTQGLKTFTNKKNQQGYFIDDIYAKNATLTIKTQLQKAGVRMANVLNTAMAH